MTATRAEARAELVAHLERLGDAGHPAVCHTVPVTERAAWTSDDPAEQRVAADLCRPCPALTACRDYGRAYPKERGVYGAETETDRRRKP
ncbi:WhiB family transcriptional regulator [Actinotalea ferrariae]|uniref:WhiB family transcriptional regulator n=1 Tax=Actinotalea ferrariae TaxID=1386098 RepID=UPI00138E182B|nr:WhiB family transcriptional regulator [Actinotalea ferrariae]